MVPTWAGRAALSSASRVSKHGDARHAVDPVKQRRQNSAARVGFASAPESLLGSKLPRVGVCQCNALILLAHGTPPLGTNFFQKGAGNDAEF